MDAATKSRQSRANVLGSTSTFGTALPFLVLLLVGIGFPLFGGGYWGVIATRACVYWVGRRIRRSDCNRLGSAADAWGLHHQRPRSGQRHTRISTLSRVDDCGRGRRHVRLDYWPAGVTPADFLFRHHDTWLCHHRNPGGPCLAERHRRWGGCPRSDLSGTILLSVGLLLFLFRSGGHLHLDDGESGG